MDEEKRGEWFATHISPHETEVRRWLRKQSSNLSIDDLDDIVQEAYARIWAALDLSPIREGRPFFFKVAHNILLAGVRRAAVVSIEPIGDTDAPRISSLEPGPEREANGQQVLALVGMAISRLPERRRRVFELKRIEGLTIEEIATKLLISKKTVQNHLTKALAFITEAVGSGADSMDGLGTLFGTDENDRDDRAEH